MSLHIRIGLFILTTCIATLVMAGEPASTTVHTEIMSLLSRLETPGCKFNRNGSWYTAGEAKTHMLNKLHYIEGRTTLKSTEQFIELVGSKSSFSGKPYLIQCGSTPAQSSATWLTAQLQSLRAARIDKGPTKPKPTIPKPPHK